MSKRGVVSIDAPGGIRTARQREMKNSRLGHARAEIETLDWRCPSGGSLLTEGGGISMQGEEGQVLIRQLSAY